MVTFPEIISATKLISHFPGWSASEAETRYVWFDAPLDIEEVTSDIFLHGGAFINLPEQHVIFELAARPVHGRRRVPLARVDWKSLKGGHTNPRYGPPEHAGRRVSNTHFHAFGLNWVKTEERMRKGNLPFAMDINEELLGFETLRKFVGESFKINNIDVVQPPKWEYDLFHDANA